MKTGIRLFDCGETYDWDLPLFRKLGLQPFDVEVWQKHFVGEVRMENGSTVKVWVECAPAQFWTFEITSGETGDVTTLGTGSGNLNEYWPFVEKVADGMIVVKGVERPNASKISDRRSWRSTCASRGCDSGADSLDRFVSA
jgi:hypothetical protein